MAEKKVMEATGPVPEAEEKMEAVRDEMEAALDDKVLGGKQIFELGPADAVKPIYALQVIDPTKESNPFMEKIQGIALGNGVLIRWNGAAVFIPNAQLVTGENGAYRLRME